MRTACTSPTFPSSVLFLFHRVEKGVWYPKVLDGASPNVTLFQFPEPVTVWIGLIHFSECDVHEIVAVNKVSVESFAIFQFNQHGLILRSIEQ